MTLSTEQILLSLAIALAAGLLMSRVAKPLGLPAVTGYLVAGILIGPYGLGLLGFGGIGFVSTENVKLFNVLSETALGFIAFTIGNEFRMSQLKKTGRTAVVVAILEALTATVCVDIAVIGIFVVWLRVLSLQAAIILGAIAAATAPAATLMVVRQYKAKGPLTDVLLPVVALDDAVGLMVFAVSFGIARAMTDGGVNLISIAVEPLLEIVLSLVLGAGMGALMMLAEKLFKSNSKRLSMAITFVLLAVGVSLMRFQIGQVSVGFSTLLVCMMLGTVFCNICDYSPELMEKTDKWTAPLFILFFVLSGAELELDVFTDGMVVCVSVVYIFVRVAGKYLGAAAGTRLMRCPPQVQRWLGVTLFPQAGVALGMSLTAATLLPGDGTLVRNIVLFGVLVYELVGPLLSKIALTRAGDIHPKPVPAPAKG